MDQQEGMGVSRRSFVKGSTVTALAALAASGGAASLFGCAPTEVGTAIRSPCASWRRGTTSRTRSSWNTARTA